MMDLEAVNQFSKSLTEETNRLNIACPRSIVEEGMKRLAEGTTAFRKMNAEMVNIDNAAKKGDIDE